MIPRQWLWDKQEKEPVQLVKIAFTEDANVWNFHYKRPHRRAIAVVQFSDLRRDVYTRFEELYSFDNGVLT